MGARLSPFGLIGLAWRGDLRIIPVVDIHHLPAQGKGLAARFHDEFVKGAVGGGSKDPECVDLRKLLLTSREAGRAIGACGETLHLTTGLKKMGDGTESVANGLKGFSPGVE